MSKPEKPYRFDTIIKPISQTDYAMWHQTLWEYIKSIQEYKPLLKKDLTWSTDDVANRGFTDDADAPGANKLTAQQKCDLLESILLKIGTYGPKSTFIDITTRSTSYKDIWAIIKRVCGFPVPGTQLIEYMTIKNSFDRNGKVTYNDHYYSMRDSKIACLSKKDSNITFNGKPITVDEKITPSIEDGITADWLESIGGIRLVKYVGQEYAKELETTSLYDLQKVIGKQEVMQTILDRLDGDEIARLNRAQGFNKKVRFNQGKKTWEDRMCYFCKELKNGKEKTHNTKYTSENYCICDLPVFVM
jgi:hypothetical protein